jgi:hypothetical protein
MDQSKDMTAAIAMNLLKLCHRVQISHKSRN